MHPEPLAPVAVHCWPIPPRGHSNRVLSQSLWGLWVRVCTRFVWVLWVSLAGMGFDSKDSFTPPAVLLGLLLCPWMWGLYPIWFLEPSRCLWIHLDLTRAFCIYITANNAEKSDDRMKLLVGSIHLQKFKLGTKTLGADHLIKEVIFYFTLHFSRIVGEH